MEHFPYLILLKFIQFDSKYYLSHHNKKIKCTIMTNIKRTDTRFCCSFVNRNEPLFTSQINSVSLKSLEDRSEIKKEANNRLHKTKFEQDKIKQRDICDNYKVFTRSTRYNFLISNVLLNINI